MSPRRCACGRLIRTASNRCYHCRRPGESGYTMPGTYAHEPPMMDPEREARIAAITERVNDELRRMGLRA